MSFREFLQQDCHYHNVLHIDNHQINNKILLNFRLSFLKDTAMAFCLFNEDPLYQLISSI